MAKSKRQVKPALTPEEQENRLIAEAIDLAERKILDGTASPQIVVHYLKLGTAKAKLENEKLREENRLLKAKTANLESQKRSEEFYQKVLSAMRDYSGIDDGEIIDEY